MGNRDNRIKIYRSQMVEICLSASVYSGFNSCHCYKLTERVLGEHSILQLAEFTHSNTVLCSDTEHVQRSLVERRNGVLELFDGGVHSLPGLSPHIPLLHHVVGDG